jgi:hypothetical protein
VSLRRQDATDLRPAGEGGGRCTARLQCMAHVLYQSGDLFHNQTDPRTSGNVHSDTVTVETEAVTGSYQMWFR